MRQYPHYLYVRSTGESTQDASGNWVSQAETVTMHSVCREETNGKGSQINGADGRAVIYSSAVFLPKSCPAIADGTEVFVCDINDPESAKRIKGRVLKFSTGQLSSRLWL